LKEINQDGKIKAIQLDGKKQDSFFISHDDFVNGSTLKSNSKLNKRNEEDNHSLASG
jgi:hypothetical protein